MAAASPTGGLGLASHAVGSTSITLPLVGDEVGQVVLQDHAGGGGVAPVMHLAAPQHQLHALGGHDESQYLSIPSTVSPDPRKPQ